ncbi:sugar transporter [Rhizoctonia solani AG-1 IA]|uniref:Sugar transporter n=1 Tax=Thanatephorus cucumeris (strain AG1-IA) TaxID=983506 RepID=L8X6T7_THACA|nr:sugar transporter [Rhizoctonia solani AG-1 IA]
MREWGRNLRSSLPGASVLANTYFRKLLGCTFDQTAFVPYPSEELPYDSNYSGVFPVCANGSVDYIVPGVMFLVRGTSHDTGQHTTSQLLFFIPRWPGQLEVLLVRLHYRGDELLPGNRATWVRGLVQNSRVFLIAVFASLGGLVLDMYSFNARMASVTNDSGTKGWLVAILELGAWFGVLCTGQLADKLGRKRTILLAVVVFVIGVIIQTAAFQPVSIFVGRFVTGLGVGSLSMAVPLYNAELAPPEVRGSLVAMQQMSIVTGTNYIGGPGENQSEAAWRIPLALQLVPALILGMSSLCESPYSPRWLVAQGRDEEAIKVLCMTRELPADSDIIQIEYLEIKAEVLFEAELEQARYPQYQDGSRSSRFKLGLSKYTSLITNRTYLIRVAVGSLTMFFQQWTVGRKPVLVSGAIIMGVCHLIIAILSARFNESWPSHTAAGWVFGMRVDATDWPMWLIGPAAWVLVAEIYPISVRGPGMSIAASSNWVSGLSSTSVFF